jgi:hypothetical protein
MAVFCLVLVELLMAWKFTYGFALLSAIAAFVMLQQFFTLNPQITSAAVCVIVIAFAAIALRKRNVGEEASSGGAGRLMRQ